MAKGKLHHFSTCIHIVLVFIAVLTMETVDFKHKPVPYSDFLMAPYPQCNSTTNLGEDGGVSYNNGYSLKDK